MKVLVIGSGGREHALVWKLAQSPSVKKIFCAPGNPGIAELAQCVDIQAEDINGLLAFAKKEKINLTVPGPEAPLVAGIADVFNREGIAIFGPTKAGAALEGSKIFAKDLMRRHMIPTGEYRTFSSLKAANEYLENVNGRVVVKADGLAAGKGVVVCEDRAEAAEAVLRMLEGGEFGDAGRNVVMEEFLQGEEVSILAVTDGHTIIALDSSQDHKAAYDGDKGPNTGGMGAISPSPLISNKLYKQIEKQILVPVVHGLRVEGIQYKGVIYAGLMLTDAGPKVLEFNCRFGDPETQAVLFRMKSDFAKLLKHCADGTLEKFKAPEWDSRPSACVVMASGGYPGKYAKGHKISGLGDIKGDKDVFVFHAGTKRSGDDIVTSGGRVLGVTAMGDDQKAAIDKAYEAVGRISFENAYWRNDIGHKALKKNK